MMLHNAPSFMIYFGNAGDGLYPPALPPLNENPWTNIRKKLLAHSLFFAKQNHGINGIVIFQQDTEPPYFKNQEADYLLTDTRKRALAVLTADCLPVVIYDSFAHAIGVVHAGWRGTLQEVTGQALNHMYKEFGSKPESLQVFLGPSAKVCCYAIQEELSKVSYFFAL
jgi:YfiH family protein